MLWAFPKTLAMADAFEEYVAEVCAVVLATDFEILGDDDVPMNNKYYAACEAMRIPAVLRPLLFWLARGEIQRRRQRIAEAHSELVLSEHAAAQRQESLLSTFPVSS